MTSRQGVSRVPGPCWPLCLWLLLTLPGAAAQAFCPTNGLRCGAGGAGVTHEDLTRRTMSELGEEFFQISPQTHAMREATEEVWKANAAVDNDQTNGFKHFDGESFPAGKQRLVTLLQGVLGALKAEDPQAARLQLGQALHTLQDFYSHSNWMEAGHSGALPSLWHPEQALPASATTNQPTCKACELVVLADGSLGLDCSQNILTPLLLSGFYGGENEVPQNPSKCRHGGPNDTGPGPDRLGGINKDTRVQQLSPHFSLHDAAANSALEASKQFIRDLKAQLTPRQLELLFGVGPSVVLVVDNSGTMGGTLAQAAQQALVLLAARQGTDQEPLRYVVVLFNGTSTTLLRWTGGGHELDSLLRVPREGAAAEVPGLAMTALLQALQASDRGVDVFLFTHVGASDGALLPTVLAQAQARDARLHALLFSTGGPLVDATYPQLTSRTGGQLFQLQNSDAAPITSLVDASVRAQAVDLLSVSDTGTGGRLFPIPIDSSVSRVTFSLSGGSSLNLLRPDGTPVRAGQSGVRIVPLSTGLLVTVLAPASGLWTATANAAGDFSLRAVGESPLALDRFEFVELFGRPGHEGYTARTGLSVSTPAPVAAEVSGGLSSPRFELRSRTGALLQTLSLAAEPPGLPNDLELFGTPQLPSLPFVVYAVGTSSTGEVFQRAGSQSLQLQP